jgi:hypothetical protein
MSKEWQTVFEFEGYEIKVQDGSGSIRLYCPNGSFFQCHISLLTYILREESLNGDGVDLDC